MRRKTSALAFTLLFALSSPLFSIETVIGPVRSSRTFAASDLSSLTADLYPAEIMLLDVDRPEFVDEIRIEVSLPDRFADDPEITIAALVYGELQDVSMDHNELSTRGRRMHFEPLVERGSTTIRVPVREDSPLRAGGHNRLDTAPLPDNFPIAVTLLPVGKGLPSDVSEHAIAVTAEPESRGVGELTLDLRTTDGEQLSFDELEDAELVVDDSPHDPSDLYIAPGFYSITLRSSQFQDATATAAIDEGVTSDVLLQLTRVPAKLFIDAPRGTQVFLNGSFVPRSVGTEIELEPGSHELSYQVGGRPVTRRIDLAPGASYTATLDMNIELLQTDEEAQEDNEAPTNTEDE